MLALALAAALLPVAANSADGPTIEATTGNGGYIWKPSTAGVSAGGAVNFRSTSAVVEHGVTWTSGPGNPNCTDVPINEGKTNWSGSCTFANPGNYAFVCTIHPGEMKGTITVGSGETTPKPPPTGSPGSPLNGPASQALKLARSQRGRSVRGSISLSQAGDGARLEVGLFATRASLLGPGHAGTMRVGRLVRSSVDAGRVSFAVSLKRPARRALQQRERLALTVKLTIAPLHQAAVKLRRGVVLHV
jgi:plastocyanin